MQDSQLKYGDYQIQPIWMCELRLNGVHCTQKGAWLGTVINEDVGSQLTYDWVKPVLINGERIPAPTDWLGRVERFLSSLDI